VKIQSLYF